jgi:predicted flavoprotein YhiN
MAFHFERERGARMKNRYKTIIIGGGASGLVAAIFAAEDVLILEKNPRVGKKIVLSGNGRCNLSNKNLSEKFYDDENFAARLFKKFSLQDTLDFFNSIGLPTYADGEGRIYPATDSSYSVLDVLRLECDNLGVRQKCNCEATEIKKRAAGGADTGVRDASVKGADGNASADGTEEAGNATGAVFEIITGEGSFFCDFCIIAVGSDAKTGNRNPSLINSIKKLGLKFFEFSPALAPLRTDDIGVLENLRYRCGLSLKIGGTVFKNAGEVQFKRNFLSGIAIFETAFFLKKYFKHASKASAAAAEATPAVRAGATAVIELDLLPDISESRLLEILTARAQNTKYKNNLLVGLLAGRIGEFVLKNADAPTLIAHKIKHLNFNIYGALDFSYSQASAGGFDTDGVDGNMQSKICKNLFFGGEILNAVGSSGGFNLQLAWSSGAIAGRAIAAMTNDVIRERNG